MACSALGPRDAKRILEDINIIVCQLKLITSDLKLDHKIVARSPIGLKIKPIPFEPKSNYVSGNKCQLITIHEFNHDNNNNHHTEYSAAATAAAAVSASAAAHKLWSTIHIQQQ